MTQEALAGRFTDGRTAAGRKVTVKPGAAGLDIRGEDGLLVAFWHAADLRADGEIADGRTLRLRCAADRQARLSVERAGAILALLPAPPRFPWARPAAGLAAVAAVGLGLWQGIPAASRHLVALVPPSWETRWGDAVAGGLERRWGTCGHPAGEAALRLLSDRLAAGLPPEMRPRRVVVVRVADENAVALPGGTVVVFDGLLKEAGDPGELAGVLAHEFTHQRLRHPTAAVIRAMGVGAAVTLLTGESSGVAATNAATALAGAYSRDDESAADAGAIALLAAAGLDSDGLARARAVEAAGLPKASPALTPEQWAALKEICG